MSQFDRLGNDMSDDIADHFAWEEMEREKEQDSYLGADELTGYEEHLRDSEGCGDARRCPRHPHVKTSSDDGMFDSDCSECEYGGEEEYQERRYAEELAAMPQWMKCRTLPVDVRCVPIGNHFSLFCNHQWQRECDTDPIPF